MAFKKFWVILKDPESYRPHHLFYFLGWLILSFFILFSSNASFVNVIPLLLILGYFWKRLDDTLIQQIKPPVEITILGVLLIYVICYGWIAICNNITPDISQTQKFAGGIYLFIQIFLVSFLLYFIGLIITSEKRNKFYNLIIYTLLVFGGLQLMRISNYPYWTLFQILLFLIIFKETAWTEILTKTECWSYFFITIIFYFSFSPLPSLPVSDFTVETISWYFIPKFFGHLLKLYLLALLIRIPFVLVYHHASLRRKFKIAGWLQTSIPQFIQFIILVFVFYFFIAGWQARNLKDSIIRLVGKDVSAIPTILSQPATPTLESSAFLVLEIPGHNPVRIPSPAPAIAVFSPEPTQSDTATKEYFLLTRTEKDSSLNYSVSKIDTTFLSEIEQGINFIAANGLMAYPFKLEDWDSLLYKVRFWEENNQYQNIRTYPFALTPRQSEYTIARYFDNTDEDSQNKKSEGRIIIFHQDIFTAGRIFIPLYDHNFNRAGYWAFDVVISPSFSFFSSDIMKQLLFWIIMYFIINILIIQRLIKFGGQINQKIIQKFNQLTLGIREVAGGNLNFKIEMEGEDEFLELAQHFNQMGNKLKKKIAEGRVKDRLEKELQIARDVQLSLLPKNLPELKGYKIAASMRTANEVGGDFYDVIALDKQKYLLVIGDVSGKSTSAAFYMAQCVSLIRFAIQFSSEPREILLRLNDYFSSSTIDKQVFVTALIAIVDTAKHSVNLFRAGHNHPIYIPAKSNTKIREVKTPGLGIGLERQGKIFQKTLKSQLIKFQAGDTLVFYTDGLVEASTYESPETSTTQQANFFGEERLIKVLKKHWMYEPSQMINTINDEISTFHGNTPLIDDMTLLIIQRQS
jgi:serine phosphatase RsbU (regulator of sigma subunit)